MVVSVALPFVWIGKNGKRCRFFLPPSEARTVALVTRLLAPLDEECLRRENRNATEDLKGEEMVVSRDDGVRVGAQAP